MATHHDASPPQPKTLGSYVIQQRIAVGGMSEVYLAVAPQAAGAERTVVVKRMLPRVADDPALRRMFSDEAALGSRIKHPNVVNVIELIEPDGDHPALAMEYVRGVDLWRLGRWLIRSGSRLEPEVAVFVASEMLRGLQAVHEARDEQGNPLGVVHRDVSPSNVLVSVHGDVKLGDLGIAQAAARERFPSADGGAKAKGKLGYLAPEQVRGRASDSRSDVFSAGVVTAELLMGRPLFSGGSELAVLLAIRDSKIHPFVEFCQTTLPDGIGEVVQQALAADPDQRPQSAAEMAERLGAFVFAARTDLQARLAQSVAAALADGAPGADLTVPKSPTRTASAPDALDPHARRTAPLLEELETLDFDEERRTRPRLSPSDSSYVITTVGGQRLGPWTFAKAVEAVSTGQLGPFDRVAANGNPEALLSDVPELARHVPVSTMTTAQGSEAQLLSGSVVSVEGGGIVGVLANAAVEHFTGLLLCEHEEIRKEVYLDAGRPTFVTSNQTSELLGEHLVSRGVITRAELDMALAVMPRFEGRLGDTLAALGLVEPVMLFRHIGEQIREKLLGLFLWNSGSCTQYVGVAPPLSSFPLELRPWDVIDEGLGWRLMRGMDDGLLARAGRETARAVPGPQAAIWLAELPIETGRLYRQFTDHAVVPASLWKPLDDMELRMKMQRAFVLLMHMGALRWQA